MKITIQAPGFTLTEAQIDFVNKHVGKLDKFYEPIISGDVSLTIEPSATKENKLCAVKLAVPGNDLFATRQGSSIEEAVQGAVDALKRQLEKLKTVRDR